MCMMPEPQDVWQRLLRLEHLMIMTTAYKKGTIVTQ